MNNAAWSEKEIQILNYEGERVRLGYVTWSQVAQASFLGRRSADACRVKYGSLSTTVPAFPSLDAPLAAVTDPSFQQLFEFLKDTPRSVVALCNKFDRSPATVSRLLGEMDAAGYLVATAGDRITVDVSSRPRVVQPVIDLASELGEEFNVAFVSDPHYGDRYSQPTAVASFVKYANERFGVTKFFQPGDLTTGVNVYRGQAEDLIPSTRPFSRDTAWKSTTMQVRIAVDCLPHVAGVQYYVMGGNHDWAHVVSTGMDPIRMFCNLREDAVYGGYDVWSIPLTDRVHLRLWHPKKSIAYAKSYHMQKAMEQQAFEALGKILLEQEQGGVVSSILAAGHVHIAIFVPEPPFYGLHCGAFQGKTNLAKRLGLTPHVGGTILQLRFRDNGDLGEIGFRFVPFPERADDWRDWPVPGVDEFSTADGKELRRVFKVEDRKEGKEQDKNGGIIVPGEPPPTVEGSQEE